MHDNTLLFMRVGLCPSGLQKLSLIIQDKEVSIRACQFWYNGDRSPNNEIIATVNKLDDIMNDYAVEILNQLTLVQPKRKDIWITKFNDDDELWSNHPDMFGLDNRVHSALINRIIVIGAMHGVSVHTQPSSVEDEDYNHKVDWGSCVNIFIRTTEILAKF